MPIQINGSGTITGLSVGGLPDGIVDNDMIAASTIQAAKLHVDAKNPNPFVYAYANHAFAPSVNNTAEKMNFDNAIADSNSDWDNTNNKFTPTVAGKYYVSVGANVEPATKKVDSFLYLYKNGSISDLNQSRVQTPAGAYYVTQLVLTRVIDMNGSSDYLEAFLKNNRDDGGTRNAWDRWFVAWRVSA